MARQRRPENAWMPPYVERYPKGYRVKRKGETPFHVADHGATPAQVWAGYERWQQQSEAKKVTVNVLFDLYFDSPQYVKRLKPSTQGDYLQYSKRLREVFGNMAPDDITSPIVQLFMDARGAETPVAANHERGFLRMVMDWGKARGLVTIPNPVDAVKNIPTDPGGRYVEDDEYEAFWRFLGENGYIMYQSAMEIAYLCAARQQDVLALDRSDIRDTGLMVFQEKTQKKQLKLWNDRLWEAVEKALKTNTQHKVQTSYILRGRTGQRFTRTGFNSTWQRAQQKAMAQGVIPARFRFHDLKIKGVSDFEGDKQRFSGHKTSSMMERYNRTPDSVSVVNKPRITPTNYPQIGPNKKPR